MWEQVSVWGIKKKKEKKDELGLLCDNKKGRNKKNMSDTRNEKNDSRKDIKSISSGVLKL